MMDPLEALSSVKNNPPVLIVFIIYYIIYNVQQETNK